MTRSNGNSRVELTQRALSDLRAIEQFSIMEWGRKTAGKYLDDIAAALDLLRESPEILRLESDFAPGLYFYRVKKHILVCDSQDDLVIVLTVMHTADSEEPRLGWGLGIAVTTATLARDESRRRSRRGCRRVLRARR